MCAFFQKKKTLYEISNLNLIFLDFSGNKKNLMNFLGPLTYCILWCYKKSLPLFRDTLSVLTIRNMNPITWHIYNNDYVYNNNNAILLCVWFFFFHSPGCLNCREEKPFINNKKKNKKQHKRYEYVYVTVHILVYY